MGRKTDLADMISAVYRDVKQQIRQTLAQLCEPRHEKAYSLHMRRSAEWQHLCFCYIDSTITLPPISKFSSLHSSSVAVKTGLSWTWLETPKTAFLMVWLMSLFSKQWAINLPSYYFALP